MTLALNPSTSIRPLEEEHLRMFRRMTSEREVIPRIALPEEAKAKVLLSNTGVNYKEAESTARRLGGRLATMMEALTNPKIFELIRNDRPRNGRISWIFIRGGVPRKEGNYRIDLARGELEPISKKKASKLIYEERLYIDESVINRMKERHPLALGGDCFCEEGWDKGAIGVIGGYIEGDLVQVAYVKEV